MQTLSQQYAVDPLGEGRYRVVDRDSRSGWIVTLRGKFTDCDCAEHSVDGPPCPHIVAVIEYVTSVTLIQHPVTMPDPLRAGDLSVDDVNEYLKNVTKAMHELTMQEVELRKVS